MNNCDMYCSIRCNFRTHSPEILQAIKVYLVHVLNIMFRLESPKSRNDFYKEPAVFKKKVTYASHSFTKMLLVSNL